MNRKLITTTTALTIAGMLSSCTTTDVANTAGIMGVGLGLGAMGSGSRTLRNAALIAGAVALTAVIVQQYQASQEQKRYAQARAAAAARSRSYAAVSQKKKVRYVAVPVKKKSSGEKSGVMLYDTNKGELASDKVYVPNASSASKMKEGSVVKVNGKEAMLESSFFGT